MTCTMVVNTPGIIDNSIKVQMGGGLMTTNGDFWGLMGTKNHGDSG